LFDLRISLIINNRGYGINHLAHFVREQEVLTQI
jgi:hypothetical protein